MSGDTGSPERFHNDLQEVHDMTIVRRTSPMGELVSLRQAMKPRHIRIAPTVDGLARPSA